MNKNIYILFDQAHDKDWLIEDLSKHYGTNRIKVLRLGVKSSEMEIKAGVFGKLLNLYYTLKPSIVVLFSSKKQDIIICWGSYAGLIVNFLSRFFCLRRELIFPGWLSPVRHQKTILLSKYAATNKHCQITITSPELEHLWERHLNIKSIGNFHYVPDMFEGDNGYEIVTFKKDSYYFTGGMANRDWNLLMNVASRLPNLHFKCVALQSDFQSKTNSVPNNVEVFFNTDSATYYELMREAKCILLPLVDTRKVSGLINIIRAAQFGVPCFVTDTLATAQYYEDKDFLLSPNVEDWISRIISIEQLDSFDFVLKTSGFQNYIKTNFSREKVSSYFFDIIDNISK